jgi:heme-degrading monooxygenase HmoA
MVENNSKNFVALNYISCKPHYKERFEQLFSSRAYAIDKLPGFIDMEVLKPNEEDDKYLIVSYWSSEENFKTWTKSTEFIEEHKRGFEDIKTAKEKGEDPPMNSSFKTYTVIAG